MAPSPAPSVGGRRRGVLRHYDRPLWRDRLFWLVAVPSVVATAAFTAFLVVLWGVPDSAWGWVRPALIALVVLNLSFRLLGVSVTASRHFQRGLGEGGRRREGDLEDKGRAAGAVVGRALRSARRGRGSATPASAPAQPTAPSGPPAVPAGAGGGTGPAAPAEAVPLEADAHAEAVPVEAEAEAEADAHAEVDGPPASPDLSGRPGPRVDGTTPAEPPAQAEPPAPAEPGAPATSPGPGEDGNPRPAPARRPDRPPVTADRAARVAGAMVGRRLAERRRRSQ